jgi:hypothetical protein
MTIQVGLVLAVLFVQAVLAWRLVIAHRAAARMEARLASHGQALSLLTDTSENGFGAIARELERLATATAKPARRPSTRRVAAAARNGRSVRDIAASERVSEGEVRLRLHLAGHESAGIAADRG